MEKMAKWIIICASVFVGLVFLIMVLTAAASSAQSENCDLLREKLMQAEQHSEKSLDTMMRLYEADCKKPSLVMGTAPRQYVTSSGEWMFPVG